jgi:hypothetical protein
LGDDGERVVEELRGLDVEDKEFEEEASETELDDERVVEEVRGLDEEEDKEFEEEASETGGETAGLDEEERASGGEI